MPKSDTWPGGPGLETIMGTDSAGSCDSVISANSALSDDSLDHLSAEEKACLLFLEETIESLGTEEDSDLSSNEQDLPSNAGDHGDQRADSITKSSEDLSPKDNVAEKPPQSHLDQAPLVSPESIPSAKVDVPPNGNNPTQPLLTAPSRLTELNPKLMSSAQAPVSNYGKNPAPPPIKPKEFPVKMGETSLPRGPLSYDALVHLRKSASEKMTPLCPKIDHTIDLGNQLPAPAEVPKQTSNKSESKPSFAAKVAPPVVAPKPKKIPAVVSVKTPDQSRLLSDSTHKLKHCSDAQAVRLEALQKLGLLREQEPQIETVDPAPAAPPHLPPKPKIYSNPSLNKLAKGPSNKHPLRSPSFCEPQGIREPGIRPLQSSTSFQHSSRHEPHTVAASHHVQPSRVKPDGATLDNHKGPVPCPKPRHIPAPHQIQTSLAGQTATNANPNAVGYTAMVVPGMGADRKEALRKLGLLKT